jgi:hypothetical protein
MPNQAGYACASSGLQWATTPSTKDENGNGWNRDSFELAMESQQALWSGTDKQQCAYRMICISIATARQTDGFKRETK